MHGYAGIICTPPLDLSVGVSRQLLDMGFPQVNIVKGGSPYVMFGDGEVNCFLLTHRWFALKSNNY